MDIINWYYNSFSTISPIYTNKFSDCFYCKDIENILEISEVRGLLVHLIFPFAGAGTTDSGALVEGRKWSALEDPVKNGACLTNVRPRRGL
jgi:hypothetical protein